MAIATDIEVNWNGTVDNTNKIGLSKPFTELPSDVWADNSAFITAYNNPAAKFTKVSNGYPTCPVKSNDCPWYLTGNIGYSNINHNSDSIYLRSAIICVPDDFVYNTWNGNQGGRIRDNINNFRIVTSMSTVKNGVDVSLIVQDGTVVGARYVLKETLTGSSSNGGITIGAGTYILMVVDIYTVEGNYYLNIPYSLPGFVYDTNNGDGVMGMWAYDSSVNKMFSLSPQIFPTDDGRISITGGGTYSVNTWNRHRLPAVDGDANLIFCASYIPWNWYLSLSGNVHYHLLAVSRFGLKFKYNDDTYKPIITQGVVTGYTTDMTVPSDIDNWTDISGHNISPAPPGPPSPTPGTWDDMPGAGSSIGALAGARCYICSKTDITNLKNWMSKTEADGGPPDGYDVLSSLISVMAFPIDMTSASSGPATAISFTGLKTSTDNQLANIAAALLSIANQVGATPKTEIKTFTSTATALPSAGNPFTIDLGTCDCPTFYSSDFPFVDYDASVELYIPFIGTMSLDTQTVMGKSLHAYMSVDPITGAIYAWCECTKDGSRVVVASGSGAFGVNTPITANQVGMAMAQIKNNAAQQRQAAIQSALTLGVGAFAGMDKNISSILSRNMTQAISQRSANIAIATGRDYMDALSVGASQAAMTAIPNAIGANLNTGRANRQIAQANHNSITGSAGGSTADWSCSYTPYLKVITPDVHRAGEQYEHTYGVPTILSGTLSTFKGLTFCANPDVSSISTATDQEKQQIFGLLSGGVYV